MTKVLPGSFVLGVVACAPVDVPVDDTDTDVAVVDVAPAPVAADAPGPYRVGATTLVVPRDDLGPLTVEVWYPAAPPADSAPGRYTADVLGIDGGAYRDAPVRGVGGPYPVVAFSHGFGGVRWQSAFLCERLASHGFVVVAPDHDGSTLTTLRPQEAADVAVRRPTDIADAVDALADPGVAGLVVDARAYAMIGHSFGAWTALAVAGGRLDLDGFEAACAAGAGPACAFFDGQTFDRDAATRWAVADPRATVAVMLAPGGWYAFGRDGSGLRTVATPLVIGGTRDGDLPYAREIRPTYDALGAPKVLATLEGAGHWGFTDLCGLLPVEDCAGAAGGFLDPADTRRITQTLAVAWVRTRLSTVPDGMRVASDAAWLDADGAEGLGPAVSLEIASGVR